MGGEMGVLAVYITRHDYDLDAGQACEVILDAESITSLFKSFFLALLCF